MKKYNTGRQLNLLMDNFSARRLTTEEEGNERINQFYRTDEVLRERRGHKTGGR